MSGARSRHVTLLVPGLSDPLPCPDRSPPSVLRQLTESLPLGPAERLLARGDRVGAMRGDGSAEGLVWGYFHVPRPIQAEWPAAAVAYLVEGRDPGQDWVMRADPVHLRPDLGDLLLFDASTLEITDTEAQALAAMLNAHFDREGWHIEPLHPQRWYVRLERAPSMSTRSVHSVTGGSVSDALPRGNDAPRWRALVNEAQMVLHAAPVNEEREGRGRPTINSIWLWGGGRLPTVTDPGWDAVWADDVLARGLSRITGVTCSPLTEGGTPWLQAAKVSGRHLIVLDSGVALSRLGDVEGWRQFVTDLNRSWLGPLLDALKAGELSSLCVVPGARFGLRITRSNLWRAWRRRRPWSEFLAECAAAPLP